MAGDTKFKVLIAGAGIAGLSVAIALRQLPYIEVELYEQAPELKEIGASIALSPNVSFLPVSRRKYLHNSFRIVLSISWYRVFVRSRSSG